MTLSGPSTRRLVRRCWWPSAPSGSTGHLDLHSGRSQVDLDRLADQLAGMGAAPDLVTDARAANTAGQVLEMATKAGLPLADQVARDARAQALSVLDGAPVAVEMLVVDRAGRIVGEAREDSATGNPAP